MKKGIWAAAFVWAMPALAQEVDCDSAMNQGDLNQCAAMDYAEADAELNAVWKEAIGTMKEIDSYLEGDEKGAEERRRRQQARAELAAAERAKAEADDALNELQSDLATARLRRDDARRRLQDAESALTAAEDAYQQAKQDSRDAANVVKAAKKAIRGS